MPFATVFKQFLRYHLPPLVYAALIVSVSSIERLSAPELGWLSTDKLAHMAEYALFAYLFYRSFSRIGFLRRGALPALSTLLFLILFAASDEYHQQFVEGRSAEALDLLADALGGSLVILLLRHRENTRRLESRPHELPRELS
ncbi:MAG: VanZ family protein [Candidatus Zixiibacteriota bacterium]